MVRVRDDQDGADGALAASCRKWTVVIPVKPAPEGKSRLLLPPMGRLSIVRAIAMDTIEAAADCDQVERVLVVTADGPLALVLATRGRVTVVHDSASGLRAGIDLGLSAADAGAPRAVLLGDLPALTPHELSSALTLAARHTRAFVPDADGVGSVLATALPGVPFQPWFGTNSADAHRRAGYTDLELPATSGLRRDLDKAEHLPVLRRLGLGRRTAALLG